VPAWVVIACYVTIGLGTMFAAGASSRRWAGITKIRPVDASAPNSPARSRFLATLLGIPVSTTHTITGSIVGWDRRIRCPRCAGA